MVARKEVEKMMRKALKLNRSTFCAVTGRRRVGKTYIIKEIYKEQMCFSMTGIQHASLEEQINNFMHKLAEYNPNIFIAGTVDSWQKVFFAFRDYLKRLPKDRKHVIFIDELPWIATPKSGFIQQLAHLWNDYLSQENHFILVVCGSATSWITNKIVNDTGGFHNRITLPIHLEPFTLAETKEFLESKNIHHSPSAIAELYMILGGLPYYLEQIERGESVSQTIARLFFSPSGILKNEYNNLYRALFVNAENHEAIVEVLAHSHQGLTREEIVSKSKVQAGGPFTRTMTDLVMSGFVAELTPYGKKKRGTLYRLTDEYSMFYHKFVKGNEKKGLEIWQSISQSQSYKIWRGLAFETLCMKHLKEIKEALGIRGVYTEVSRFEKKGDAENEGFQIDLLIDRKDATINLCECKFYESDFTIDKEYAQKIKRRKVLFAQESGTKKLLINTFISNEDIIENPYSLEVVDAFIHVNELIKKAQN